MAKQTVAEKRDGEKLLVSEMIALYCRKQPYGERQPVPAVPGPA